MKELIDELIKITKECEKFTIAYNAIGFDIQLANGIYLSEMLMEHANRIDEIRSELLNKYEGVWNERTH